MPPRAIAHATYIKFANKYKIPLTKANGNKKSITELAKDIYNYEMRYIYHPNKGKGKYGFYINK